MADTVPKLISHIAEEGASFYHEFEQHHRNYSQTIFDLTKEGKRRILEVSLRPTKRPRQHQAQEDERENVCPNIQSSQKTNKDSDVGVSPEKVTMTETDDKIDVLSLKVAELRKELKLRGISSVGLKKDLQTRLIDALEPSNDHAEESHERKEATIDLACAADSSAKESQKSTDYPTNVSIDDDKVNKDLAFSKDDSPPVQMVEVKMEVEPTNSVEEFENKPRQVSSECPAAEPQCQTCTDSVEMEDVEDVVVSKEERGSFATSVTKEMSQLSVDSDACVSESNAVFQPEHSKSLAKKTKTGTNSPEAMEVVEEHRATTDLTISGEGFLTQSSSYPKTDVETRQMPDKCSPIENIARKNSKVDISSQADTPTRFMTAGTEQVDRINELSENGLVPINSYPASSSEHEQSTEKEHEQFKAQKPCDESKSQPPKSQQSMSTEKEKTELGSVKRLSPTGTIKASSTGTQECISGGVSSSSEHNVAESQNVKNKVEEKAERKERKVNENKVALSKPLSSIKKQGGKTATLSNAVAKNENKPLSSTTSSKTPSQASSEEKKDREKERQRLAEMRGKMREQAKAKMKTTNSLHIQKKMHNSKNTSATKDPMKSSQEQKKSARDRSEQNSATKTGLAATNSTALKKEEKMKQLTTQMREKAAAEAKKKANGNNLKNDTGETSMQQRATSKKLVEKKGCVPPEKTLQTKIENLEKIELASAQKKATTLQKQPPNTFTATPVESASIKQQKKVVGSVKETASLSSTKLPSTAQKIVSVQKPAITSPMDTYEMSDREDSESSDDESEESEDESNPRKRVPMWAQRTKLVQALNKQFSPSNPVDPDEIFGQVYTCNLSEIFDQKKGRYLRRTSSGDWTRDKITVAEQLTYKRTMGFQGKS